jgi:hypothetical protein
MRNHIHLLLETKEVPLSKIMQGILQSYTQFYNRKYSAVGHLFQGRYKAILCDKDSYLLELVRYIHLNPVRSREVEDPADYYWSSHRAYLGRDSSAVVDSDFVLSHFSNLKRRARKLYERFILDRLKDELNEEFKKGFVQMYLGDEDFIEEVNIKTHQKSLSKGRTLHDVLDMVRAMTGLEENIIRGRKRNENVVRARSLFVHLSLQYTNSKRKEIAQFLERDAKIVTYLENKFKKEMLTELDKIKKIWTLNS